MTPRRLALMALAIGLLASTASAQEPIRFARTPDISPEGKWVAFSYLGDIWLVESVGGVARPVTMHEAHDINPVFSPDGRWLAFSSNRHGSYDVFVVPVEGGKPRRLTFDSAADHVTGWTSDGKHVLFASTRGVAFPSTQGLFTVPVDGGPEKPMGIADVKEASVSPSGDLVAYSRGPGAWYRKGYRGSSNDDIWVAKFDGTGHRRVTTFDGQDGSPMWSPDGRRVLYVSEQFGVANVVAVDVTPTGFGSPVAITRHTDDSVRRARISRNGEWIVYECGCDLWLISTRGGSSRRIAIEARADDKSNPERVTTFSRGITSYAPSPDERHAAIIVHGELFIVPLPGGGKATRVTDHPAYDHAPVWAPDGKAVLFASDRGGQEDFYLAQSDDPESPEMAKATRFKVKALTNSSDSKSGASYSPDGKRIAFLKNGQLWTMLADGSGAKAVVSERQVFDYEWSPDGRWFVYARSDGSFAAELYITPSDGGSARRLLAGGFARAFPNEFPRNITRYAMYNGDVTWSATGNRIAFISQRRGDQGIYALPLQKPGTGEASGIDWEDIHLRAERVAPISAEEGAISRDGARVAFRSRSSGDDLWVAGTDGRDLTRVTTGNLQPRQIRWSKRIPGMVYFLDSSGTIRMSVVGSSMFSPARPMPGTAGTGSSEPARVSFNAKLIVKRDEEYAEMFEQSWRALAESFYDPAFHGADWKAVREKYRPIVKHIAQKEDLYAMLHLMLGELNASHLGVGGFGSSPEEVTADLGLIFDASHAGPGLKIAEIVKRGPADRRGLNLKPGDIISAIDRSPIDLNTNLSQRLNGKVGDTVSLDVLIQPNGSRTDPKNRRRVEVTATTRESISGLMYERWVQQNADRVTKLSRGKLGYIHIPSMDEPGLERFVRSLYSDNFDKEALIIDVRFNGGGFTHDQVLNYLTGKEHTVFRQRDGGDGLVLRSFDRKWTKPMTVLINNRSYSDAEIFPSAFRTLGLGKLVGQPTGGFVIGTTAVRLIDGSYFRVPRTGVYSLGRVNMEKEGVRPDVLVEPHPEQLLRGEDPQLDKAVEVLTADWVAWLATRSATAGVSGRPSTGAALPAPAPGPTPKPPQR
jgi:tricorn protease